MPQIEEIGNYIKGIWLLILGDKNGFDWLDITALGVWRSFAAFLWCLPPMAVGWAAWRLYYLANMPTGAEAGLLFILKLCLSDVLIWILPPVLLAIFAKPLGYADMLAPIIIATNWLSVPIAYALAVPIVMSLLVPASEVLAYLLSWMVLLANFAALLRLLKTITSEQMLLAAALAGLTILPALFLGRPIVGLLGLMPA